jgi:DNA-binding transcriptional LysR family regulator
MAIDWNDLPYFLAVANEGSLARAASLLGVNHSTVFRRINGMEQRLQARLFERLPDGYRLTAAGTEILPLVREADESIQAMGRVVAGKDVQLSGQIRITTAPDLARLLVAPCLAAFRRDCPGIRVEVTVSDSDYDLGRREADLALRATPRPPEHLVGRKVRVLPWHAWAAPAYLEECGRPTGMDDLASHRLIGSDEGFRRLPVFAALHGRFGQDAFAATASDLSTMGALAASGIGVAFLPFDSTGGPGEHGGRLERLFQLEPRFASSLWILTHPDLRHVARIRALAQFLFDFLREDRGGVSPGPGD